MLGGFVVTGTRPASVLSTQRPNSGNRRHSGYHILAKPSYVDESLFGSQHHKRLDEDLKSFKAPWEYPKPPTPRKTFADPPKIKPPLKSEHKGRPLLWCPTPNDGTSTNKPYTKARVTSVSGTHSVNSDCLWNTRDHFRRLKHTPTYVDESLFGEPLQEPSFEAPWNERKKGEKKPVRPYLFDPSGGSESKVTNDGVKRRPASALGLSRTHKRTRASSDVQPVWKP